MNKEKENKKGVKNSRLSKETVAVVASVVAAIVEVLNFGLDIYSTQASNPTQVYVEGNQNTVVLCEQSYTTINLP